MSGRAAPRPKRAAETYARTHHQEDGPSSKKPRFDARNPSTLAPDAPEEDEVLDADVIGKGAATKRNAVNIDGYDSDSSNDNFNARADAKAKEAKDTKAAEDQDMFADLDPSDGDDDEELSREGKKKKKVAFMESKDVEGAVATSKAGGHVSANLKLEKGKVDDEVESSSDSGGDEERDRVPRGIDAELGAGHKKKHAPKLDAFNMKAEGEEGRFDENGNFVRKAGDPDAVHDTWLEGISKRDMKKAREAHEKREEEERKRRREDDEILISDLLSSLIIHLDIGETALEALQRLNKGRKQPIPKWKQKKMERDGTAMDVDPIADAAEQKKKEAIDAITDAATKLMNKGTDDIYEQERELLTRWYKRETGDDWLDAPGENDKREETEESQQFEFRYAQDPNLTSNGPYARQTLQEWIASGQFQAAVEFKRVGSTEWTATL